MSACEECWATASQQAFLLGGSAVYRYLALINNPDNDHHEYEREPQ